ncbi:hypothetical protein [Inquilinus sp. CA228]|uniref:hypothetical protein n=1 Tax=Inquilinus sp. CA228 TaxID=3455609 RepID=UPI003F8D6A1E
MRNQVADLARLGPMPASRAVGEDEVAEYQRLLEGIRPPVSDEEATVLCRLFGDDDFFGLAWALLHLIESAPGWPIPGCLLHSDNEWIQTLRQRLLNSIVPLDKPN